MNPGDRSPPHEDGISATATAPDGAPPAAPDKPKKKTLWETTLTATPILLTIVATLLAGMSSSQMTRAMYHRSIAAQEESKGANQWAFFQAKRIRGTNLEMTLVGLRARPDYRPVKLAKLPGLLRDQAAEYRRLEKEAGAVADALKKAQPPDAAANGAVERAVLLGLPGLPPVPPDPSVPSWSPLAAALDDAEALRKLAGDKARESEAGAAKLEKTLAEPLTEEQKGYFARTVKRDGKDVTLETRGDLLYFLDDRDLPVIKEEEGILDKNGKQEKNPLNALNPALDDVNPLIRLSIAAVADRKPDQEIGNLLRGRGRDGQPLKGPDGQPLHDKKGHKVTPVTHEQLHDAAEIAERRAKACEDVDDLVNDVARGFEAVGDDQARRAADVAAAADRLKISLAALSAAEMPAAGTAAPEAPDLGKSRASADVLATRGNRLKGDAQETAVGVKGVLLDFDARRYRQEARYNQGVAGIRDLQARLSAFTSDAHHKKSELFFYGMLAAQGGVTIATFALAVRYKGLLWGLATLAGLLALSIGTFVLLS
jgi:hypothetical protein